MSKAGRDPAAFYDDLAARYHLLYADWAQAVADQGGALQRLLASHGVLPGAAVLDAACGIGTQTLGLVQGGYAVTACDVSPQAVQRLRDELAARGLSAQVRVDDLRTLSAPDAAYAAVLACDNALPHLLTDAELLQALRQCHRCLAPGGVAVFSVRDYAATPRISPDVRPYGFRRLPDANFLAVQVWEWDGDHYDLRMYLTTEHDDGRCDTRVTVTRYYAVTVAHLMALMAQAGFVAVTRLDGVLFQPVLLGRKAA